jgi:hypothetical protein
VAGSLARHMNIFTGTVARSSVPVKWVPNRLSTRHSFSLEVETTGRWPWQKREIAAAGR